MNFILIKHFIVFSAVFIAVGFTTAYAEITICSWNIRDFGQTKDDSQIQFIANVVKQYDIIAIQEVVAGYGGAQAVARLSDQLNRMGAKWDYVVSDPTSGNSYKRERYAFIWKTSTVKRIGDAWLEQKYEAEIDREPFYMDVRVEGKVFTVANFHAITKSMQPETEVKYFKYLPELYSGKNIIFCGDFNLPESHSVFNPLKQQHYRPVLQKQKTSLRQKCIDEDCLASEYDNIFYDETRIKLISSGIVHFYKAFDQLEEALKLSDHVPVVFTFSVVN
jgi:deoxyribonuclease-1-like protein